MRDLIDRTVTERHVRIPAHDQMLDGDLTIPSDAFAAVVFVHGSGHISERERYVARELQQVGLATLMLDLLTEEEERVDYRADMRFNTEFLSERMVIATEWLRARPETAHLPIGYLGTSTSAGAALVAATMTDVRAVVSPGGRPDIAETSLPEVKAPTLMIVGSDDRPVVSLNREAMSKMRAQVRLEVIPGATHLFEEPGALEEVARLAGDWFEEHLQR